MAEQKEQPRFRRVITKVVDQTEAYAGHVKTGFKHVQKTKKAEFSKLHRGADTVLGGGLFSAAYKRKRR